MNERMVRATRFERHFRSAVGLQLGYLKICWIVLVLEVYIHNSFYQNPTHRVALHVLPTSRLPYALQKASASPDTPTLR